MAYTTIDKPTDYFETILYTGNGSTLNVGGLDFTQDFTWIKNRGDTTSHFLYDTVRGAGNDKDLRSNSTGAEGSGDGATHGFMSAFRSDGFTVNQGSSTASITNANTNTYASWNWKAGTSFTNDASSTSVGTIDSTGSVSDTAGFSIVSYTGTGSAGTIKHGLNSTPSTIILKNRIDGSIFWYMYHKSLGNNTELYLNGTDAAPSSTSAWNTTSPTSSVFSVGSHGGTNASGEATIAYVFAEKKGYSKFGSYTGNGNADGTFVYTGFKPAFFLLKSSSSGTSSFDWVLLDNKRPGYNVVNKLLYPNGNFAEGTADIGDFTSNGFKIRSSNQTFNKSGDTFIYMAFAESPFVSSSGVPTTAR